MILDDVAGDVGELEGDAEIGGAIERVVVGGIDAHDHRHHAADRAGDMVAIAQHVVLGPRPPALGVEREAGEMVVDEAARDRRIRARPRASASNGAIADRLAGQRALRSCRAAKATRAAGSAGATGIVAERLAVGDDRRRRGTSIEQPGALAGLLVEQVAGEAEATSSPRG